MVKPEPNKILWVWLERKVRKTNKWGIILKNNIVKKILAMCMCVFNIWEREYIFIFNFP